MKSEERDFLLAHRCHDFEALIQRWRRVADAAGLRMEAVAESDGLPIYVIESAAEPSRARGLYLSAGIHGDEPAAAAGLVGWAERRAEFLSGYPLTIFPCLNPWGLINNCRLDAQGNDLNRMFDGSDLEAIRLWQDHLRGREFRLALCLHEDYDAQGVYIYELARERDCIGERMLQVFAGELPRQPGGEVEGRAASNGVVTPDREIEEILREIEGMPEAIFLYLHHTDTSLTFETPSEYSLFGRVRAHERVLDAVAGLLES